MILRILISLCLIILSATRGPKTEYTCKKSDRNKACTLEYLGVCGWFNENIRCLKYPCAITFGTICQACSDPSVQYVTKGECPEGI